MKLILHRYSRFSDAQYSTAGFSPSDALSSLDFSSARTASDSIPLPSNAIASISTVRGDTFTQSNVSKQPIYGIHPSSGLRNILLSSALLDGSGWSSTVTVASTGSSILGIPEYMLTRTSTAYRAISQPTISTPVVPGEAYTVSIYARAGSLTSASLAIISGSTDVRYAYNLTTGTVTGQLSTFGTGYVSSSATSIGGGWVRITLTAQAGSTSIGAYFYPGNATSASAGTVYFAGAQLEAGATASAFQRTVTRYECYETNFSSVPYLYFDGSAACLSGSVTVPANTVVLTASATRLSNTSSVLLELGANADASANAAVLRYNGEVLTANVLGSNVSIPTTDSISTTLTIDTATNAIELRSIDSSSTASSIGSLASSTLHIGARANTSAYFYGRLYNIGIDSSISSYRQLQLLGWNQW